MNIIGLVCLYSTQQLVKFNVSADDMTWNRVTMTSDSFVCIRQRKIPPSHYQQQVLFCFVYRVRKLGAKISLLNKNFKPRLDTIGYWLRLHLVTTMKLVYRYPFQKVAFYWHKRRFSWHSVAYQTIVCPCISLRYLAFVGGAVITLQSAEAKSVWPNAQSRCNHRLHKPL